MKLFFWKVKAQNDSFPKSSITGNKEITDKKAIAENFNSFFVNNGTNLAAKIPHCTNNFESYLSHTHESHKKSLQQIKSSSNEYF